MEPRAIADHDGPGNMQTACDIAKHAAQHGPDTGQLPETVLEAGVGIKEHDFPERVLRDR